MTKEQQIEREILEHGTPDQIRALADELRELHGTTRPAPTQPCKVIPFRKARG